MSDRTQRAMHGPAATRERSTYAGFGLHTRWLWHVAWAVIASTVLGACIVGAPIRVRELIVPAQSLEETAAIGRMTVEEQAVFEELGIGIPGLILYEEILALLLVALCAAAAAGIYWRRRDSRIAWIASLFLLVVSTSTTFNVYALARAYPALHMLASLQSMVTLLFPVLLFYTFPSGRFEPRWTRWVVVAFGVFLVSQGVLVALHPELAVQAPGPGYVLGVAVLAGGVVAQVVRYIRISTALERQQTKWVITALALQSLVFAMVTFTSQLIPGMGLSDNPTFTALWEFVLFQAYVVTFALIPIAVFVAILRYRLWDIDLIINRSLVYGGLSTFLAVLMTAVVLGVRQAMLALTDGEQLPLALAASALLAGLLFQPTRRLLQRAVDRRIYGIEIDYQVAAARPRLRRATGSTPVLAALEALGEYDEITWIGRGGMADVYRARHLRLDRTVAIKVLPAADGGVDLEHVRRFEREARIVAQLRHPNIVQLFDFGQAGDGSWYLVMEYISALDLRGHVTEAGSLPLPRAIPLLQDVASALDHAHRQGVVHRDVKPSNVLLQELDPAVGGRSHRAVLTDFGIAKLSAATAMTDHSVMGTLEYIAPEQIRDAADVDHRADLYAFGVMAFFVLTGRRPFERDSAISLMLAHLKQPAPDPRDLVPGLPRRAAKAVMRAMAKDPVLRFGTAAEMVARLASALDSPPVPHAPAGNGGDLLDPGASLRASISDEDGPAP